MKDGDTPLRFRYRHSRQRVPAIRNNEDRRADIVIELPKGTRYSFSGYDRVVQRVTITFTSISDAYSGAIFNGIISYLTIESLPFMRVCEQ